MPPAREGRQLPTYIAVEWIHEVPAEETEPVMLYSELDDDRWETRKVEVWADGSTGWADADHSINSGLGEARTPSIDDIAALGPFRPREITAAEFEDVWRTRHGPIGPS